MALIAVPEVLSSRLPFTILISAILAVVFLLNLRKPRLPSNAPALISGLPVVGSWDYFTKRWDFYKKSLAKVGSNTFSFWAGDYHVVAFSGEEARQTFFESRDLDLAEGYRVLLGGTPGNREAPLDGDYFARRLVNLVKGGALRNGLPSLISDIQTRYGELAKNPTGTIQPFQTIYELVFQLTMRTVGCEEIANDSKTADKMLEYFETIEACGDKPLSVIYPAVWTIHKVRKLVTGIKLYTIIDTIVKNRKKTGRREKDAMQYLLDQGDSSLNIVEFIMGALYAGQLNSGINAAWLILHISDNKYWHDQVLAEVKAVADKHAPDTSLPLRDRLTRVPIEAWESEFPMIDLCLKESIRMNLQGTAFRRNVSGHDVKIDNTGKVVPHRSFAIYHVAETHFNPNIYTNPSDWDPGRYLPDRAEHEKAKHAWFGWGVGRHPCLGMRFAKLETYLIIAFWVAFFDSDVVDANGNVTNDLPERDINASSAKKPVRPSYVRYRTKTE